MIITLFIFLIIFTSNIIIGKHVKTLPYNTRDQISKNTDSIFKLDQSQYKLSNQLMKLQDDVNHLVEEINNLKENVKMIFKGFEGNSTLKNNNKQLKNINSNFDDHIVYISPTDGHIWKINDVSSFWNKVDYHLISKRFYTDGNYGYQIRLKLDNPFGRIRIMIEILKGKFDSLLPWPFNNEIEVSLLSQNYPYNHYTVKSFSKADICLYRTLSSIKRYSYLYSVSLKTILFRSSRNERDPLIIKLLINNGKDLGHERTFNKNIIIWRVAKFYQMVRLKNYETMNYSFYTGDYGYKLQLILYPNGLSNNGELNLFLSVLKGDYDQFLWWPFKYNITVTIYNKSDSKNMCPVESRSTSSKRSASEFFGFIFFNKSDIEKLYPSVIKNNQLFIKFHTKYSLSCILNTNENRINVKSRDILWTLERFDQLKYKSSISSETYLLSSLGYHMRFSLFLNGDRSTKGSFASIYAYIVKGSYDHILPWPCSLKISMSILDGQNNTIDNNIKVTSNNLFITCLKPSYEYGNLIAYSRFMKLTQKDVSKYVFNNNLVIKITISN